MFTKIQRALHHITPSQELGAGGFMLILLLLIGASVYAHIQLTLLSVEVSRLNSELASTTELLQSRIADATTSLGTALQEDRNSFQAKLGDVEGKVGSISGTVTDLQKLSKIDPELLIKYSKVFFLSDNYAPGQLIDISSTYLYNEKAKLQVIPQVLPYLKRLMEEAKDEDIDLYILSAYRSFGTQATLKDQYTVTYGAGTANQFSADQGYSEHQLGTTVDFITTGLGGSLTGFEKTAAYKWLLENAYRYGFVLSYPENNGYYIFEPWHWRFVGDKLARDLHSAGEHFYEMDQRTIDTYLISIFD